MAFEYIDQSIEVMEQIRRGGLELYPSISHTDETGGSVNLVSVGKLAAASGDIAVCVKYRPIGTITPIKNRIRQEITTAALLRDKAPDLIDRLPLFIGQITIGDRGVAIITEDATRNARLPIFGTPVSTEDVDAVSEAFEGDDEWRSDDIFNWFAFKNTLAFKVGGKPRWLDFSPSPFSDSYRCSKTYKRYIEEAYDRESELSWLLDSLEELGIQDAKLV